MTFSAFCTMRSKRLTIFYVIAAVMVILTPSSLLGQNGPAVPIETVTSKFQPLLSVLEANSLESKGKVPFHLKMSFQIYGFDGEPQEKAVLEEWWAAEQGHHLEVSAPSFGTRQDFALENLPDSAKRSLFLVSKLRGSLLTPGQFTFTGNDKLITVPRSEGKLNLSCMHVEPLSSPSPSGSSRTVCTDQATGAIRLIGDPVEKEIRNNLAAFHGTVVALDAVLTLCQVETITSHIDLLQGFDPSHTTVPLERPETPSHSNPAFVSHTVLAGRMLHKVNPAYPEIARQNRVSGSVLLHGTISDTGTMSKIFPVASSASVLTAAATQAVQQWTYQPYLLNGKPVEVETTVTVNFSLNANSSRF